MRLDFGDTDEAADAAEGLADALEDQYQEVPAHRRKKRCRADESFPDYIPRYEETAEIDEALKQGAKHGERKLLPKEMWDKTSTLEYTPPKALVRVTLYPKYACARAPECGIVSPERPTSLVEGNRYDTSVAAQVITGKYGYHLPPYRQQDYFANIGWRPSRSTLYNILAQSHFVLEPLLDYFRRLVQRDSVVATAMGPELFFDEYEGTLLGDCWSGFESIVAASHGKIQRATCNAHARRKIIESQAYPKDRRQWMLWYRELFDTLGDRAQGADGLEAATARPTAGTPNARSSAGWVSRRQEFVETDSDETSGR